MDGQTGTPAVRKVRTFADDMRRAEARGETPAEEGAHHDAVISERVEEKKDKATGFLGMFFGNDKKEEEEHIAEPANDNRSVETVEAPPAPEPVVPPSHLESPVAAKPLPKKAEVPRTKQEAKADLDAELSGAAPEPKAFQKKPDSHLTTKDDVFDIRNQASDEPDGVIVTNMKRKRWSFTKAVGKAINSWAHDQKENFEDFQEARKPLKPTTAPASMRADVINKAGEKSAIAPRDDRKKVIEKLRTFERDAEQITGTPYKIKEAVPKKPASWTHTDEETTKTVAEKSGRTHVAPVAAKPIRSIKQARQTIRPAAEAVTPQPKPAPEPAPTHKKEPVPVAQAVKRAAPQKKEVAPKTRPSQTPPAPVKNIPPKQAKPTLSVTKQPVRPPVKEPAPAEIPAKPKVAQSSREKAPIAKKTVQKMRTLARDVERVTGKHIAPANEVGADEPRWSKLTDAKPTKVVAESREQQAVADAVGEFTQKERGAATAVPITPAAYRRGDVVPKGDNTVAPTAEQTVPDHTFAPAAAPENVEEKETVRREIKSLHGVADVAPVVPHSEEESAPAETKQEATAEDERTAALAELDAIAKRRAPKAVSRDLEFTVPKFERKESTTLRTYRDDAIQDVEDRQLSVPHIAAAEAKRDARQQDAGLRTKRSFAMPLMIAGLIIVLVGGGAFGGYLWFTNRDTTTNTPDIIRVPSFIGAVSQSSIPFSTSRTELLTTMDSGVDTATGQRGTLAQLYPSVSSEVGVEPVSTGAFMNIFDPRAPGSFIRSLESDMMFGVYFGANNEPFFVFKTNRFDTAFAGMLEWEGTMSADLSPLFGEPITRSFDPTARTVDGTRTAFFKDETIRNQDVRTLYDSLGEARLMYSFVDRDTIVITTTAESLIALIEALR